MWRSPNSLYAGQVARESIHACGACEIVNHVVPCKLDYDYGSDLFFLKGTSPGSPPAINMAKNGANDSHCNIVL